MRDALRVLDLFSGIGGFSLGLERAGAFKTVAFCEIDPFCRQVLAKHWPEVPILGDIATTDFPAADVIVGGFPCQDVSRAGKRAGLSGARSGLYRELVRAIRLVRPRHAIVENVAALVNDGLGTVLGDLAESGYDAEWDCVPAEALGAPHERDRVWIVAHATSEDDGCGHAGAAERQEPQPGSGACPLVIADADCVSWRRGTGREDRAQTGHSSESGAPADSTSVGCGARRTRRPPDSFARVRDAARRHAADAHRSGLEIGKGVGGDARSQLSSPERTTVVDVWQSRWPCEPALLGVDDGIPDRVDRTRALGNALIPQIPELIGRAILAEVENV